MSTQVNLHIQLITREELPTDPYFEDQLQMAASVGIRQLLKDRGLEDTFFITTRGPEIIKLF